MNFQKLLGLLALFTSLAMHAQPLQLEISGSMIIGNSNEINPTAGTIRWTGDDFEAYNGQLWVTMTGGKTAPASDSDGNVYETLRIGNQIWFLENLRTSTYADGTPIPLVTDNSQWSGLSTGAYCWYENNNIHDIPYGKLYNWYAVEAGEGLCPEGWHVATEQDYDELIDFLGGPTTAGGKMKQEGTNLWIAPNTGATNESKFNAVPAAYRNASGGSFPVNFLGLLNHIWTSDESVSADEARAIGLNAGLASATKLDRNKRFGHSVRCVK